VGSGVGGTHVGGGAVTPVGTADDAAIAGPARSINIARSMEATRSVYAALLLCTVTDGEGGVVAPEEDEEHEHEILGSLGCSVLSQCCACICGLEGQAATTYEASNMRFCIASKTQSQPGVSDVARSRG
jgi:hypothetical protein